MAKETTHIRYMVGRWGRGEHSHIIIDRFNPGENGSYPSVYCTGEVSRYGLTRATQVTALGEELTAETASRVTCKKCQKKLAMMVDHAAKFQEFGGDREKTWEKYFPK